MAKNLQANYTQESTQPHLSNELVSKLFVRMGSNYGHLWTSIWKTDDLLHAARKEWALELGRYDSGIIGQALRKCKATHLSHPPTLPQFSALCKSFSPTLAAHKDYVAIGRIKTAPDDAKNNIKNLRDAINGTGVLIDA